MATVLVALLLAGACGRGGSEQRVSSRGLDPTTSTQPSGPEVTTSTDTATSSTEPATSSTTAGPPTTTRPRPTSTTSTSKPEPVCSPVATTFPLGLTGGTPGAVTVAPDGAVWFTYRGTKSIGRLGPDGQATLFPLNMGREAGGIAAAPDGSIWFTQWVPADFASGRQVQSDYAIGRRAPDGTIADFPIPTAEANPMGSSSFGVSPTAIVAGPDGAMWFIESGADKVGRVTADGVVTEYDLPERDRMHANPEDITVGPDGAIYVTETLKSRVARIDVATGVITELPPPGTPVGGFAGITAGPDGALWFSVTGDSVGRMTTAGTLKKFPVPATVTPRAWPWDLVTGLDGTVWFIEETSARVLRVDARGKVSEVATFGRGAMTLTGLQQLAAAKDAVWLSLPGGNQLARITCAA